MEEINLFFREDAAVAEIVQLKDEAKRVAREASTHSFSDTMRISSFLRVLSIIDYYQHGLLSWNEVGINCARRRDGLDPFILMIDQIKGITLDGEKIQYYHYCFSEDDILEKVIISIIEAIKTNFWLGEKTLSDLSYLNKFLCRYKIL